MTIPPRGNRIYNIASGSKLEAVGQSQRFMSHPAEQPLTFKRLNIAEILSEIAFNFKGKPWIIAEISLKDVHADNVLFVIRRRTETL